MNKYMYNHVDNIYLCLQMEDATKANSQRMSTHTHTHGFAAKLVLFISRQQIGTVHGCAMLCG